MTARRVAFAKALAMEGLERRRLLSTIAASVDLGKPLPAGEPAPTPVKSYVQMGVEPSGPPGGYLWRGGKRYIVSQEGSHLLLGAATGASVDSIRSALAASADVLGLDPAVDRVDAKTLVAEPVKGLAQAAATLATAAVPGVAWAVRTFIIAETGAEVGIGNEIIALLRNGADAAGVFADATSFRPLQGTSDQFIVTLDEAPGLATVAAAQKFGDDDRVLWAEPNLYNFVSLSATTNDPLAASQWHLNNTQQNGAKLSADAKVQAAWDSTTGSAGVITAIVDSGVQLNHPDLAANIWVNPGEIAANGIDDDANGWIDDINGWDFSDNDNNANPATIYDNHGTAVAGVTSAVGNNSLGVAGVAYGAKLMSVKIFKDTVGNGGGITSDANIAQAVYYAAGRTANGAGTWNSATIQNHSWGGPGPFSQAIVNAFTYANTTSRSGKGQPVFVATGNAASDYGRFQLTLGATANWQFEWRYTKDANTVAGNDTAWLGYIQTPTGSIERFDSASMPAGWTTNGNANWTVVDDPSHAIGVGRYELKAGAIGHSQTTNIRSPVYNGSGPLFYSAWVSSEAGFDKLTFWYSVNGGAFTQITQFAISGVNVFNSGYRTAPDAPANIPGNIAVGGSTDWDYRSDYAQYGAGTDFVAPTSGGFAGIYTADRTSTDGYNTTSGAVGDYTSGFGGTSSATPLAAGIGALILSKNPTLTAAQVRQIMRDSADKIGGVTYVSGFNQYYGYGRVNAAAALAATPSLTNSIISGQVYEDRNSSALLDGGEPTLNGVTVFLDTNNNGLLDGLESSTTTAGSGNYSFATLSAAAYHVRAIPLAGYISNSPASGSADVIVDGSSSKTQNLGHFPILYSGTALPDSYLLRVNAGAPTKVDIVLGATTWTAMKPLLPSLTFNPGQGNDTLTIEYDNGNPIPAGGVFFDGGASTDALIVTGSSGADVVTIANALAGPSAGNININDAFTGVLTVENVTFSGNVGSDSLTIASAPVMTTLVFNGGTTVSDQDTLTLNAGSYSFPSDLGATTANLAMNVANSGTSVAFDASQHLASLTINNASVALAADGSRVINTGVLGVTGTGKLDLTNNDMIVRLGAVGAWNGSAYAGITGLGAQGHAGGTWAGNGVVTTQTAATAPRARTTLGVAQASEALNILPAETAVWGGETVTGNSVLVKYTYIGDSNLSGDVTGDDYFSIDNGFPSATGYVNGDFNYSGLIDADDYFWIDSSYASQGPLL